MTILISASHATPIKKFITLQFFPMGRKTLIRFLLSLEMSITRLIAWKFRDGRLEFRQLRSELINEYSDIPCLSLSSIARVALVTSLANKSISSSFTIDELNETATIEASFNCIIGVISQPLSSWGLSLNLHQVPTCRDCEKPNIDAIDMPKSGVFAQSPSTHR